VSHRVRSDARGRRAELAFVSIWLRHDNDCDSATMRSVAVDGVMAASKALVGIAARSLAALDDDEVTLPQFRALLLVVEGRAHAAGDLSALLDVHASNATRLVDRLVAKGLVARVADDTDRRVVTLVATSDGRAAVARVMRRRRRVVEEILDGLDGAEVAEVGAALARFAAAAGEVADLPAEEAWRLGWGS
jgi:DNA-binding MarR family transcriptional regulator